MQPTKGERHDPLRAFFAVREWLHNGADGMKLTQLDRAVLTHLAGFMDPDGTNGRPSTKTLGDIVGADARSVMTCLKRLRRLQLITPTVDRPHAGKTQVWQITVSFAARLQEGRSPETLRTERVAPQRGEGRSPARRGSLPRDPTVLPTKTDTSPKRNEPGTCSHRATSDEGWCAGCSTQVKEIS